MPAKLIHSVTECAYRAHEKCFHPCMKRIMNCKPKGEENFPSNCPLPYGILAPKIHKVSELNQLKNKENPT